MGRARIDPPRMPDSHGGNRRGKKRPFDNHDGEGSRRLQPW
jgi:hypothetical protein